MSGAPAPLQDWGSGPVPSSGVLIEVAPDVIRLTAPNPSMMTGPGTNTYIVGGQRVVVIDPGPDDADHRQRIVDAVAGRSVEAVVVTHTHVDHAPGANPLGRVLGAPCLGFGPGDEFRPDATIVDGDVIETDAGRLRAIHTPGHASNHLCYLFEDQGMVFTGDHVMEGSTVVIRPPDGDLAVYLTSLEKLRDLFPPIRSLAPGHGRVIADPVGVIDDVLRHRADRHAIVLAALHEVESSDPAGLVDRVYPGIEDQRRDVATATLWAHLQLLVAEGSAEASGDQSGRPDLQAVYSVGGR